MSAARPGRLSRSASRIVVKPANGFHLLRIDGYSQTKTILPGQKLSSQHFIVGDHVWRIDYYPNGRAESNSDAIAIYLQLIDDTKSLQQARYKFSLLNNAGIAAYELPAETGSFTGVPNVYPGYNPGTSAAAVEETGPGYGHEEFIGKEELERRREDLIRNDSIVIQCDVGVTQIDDSDLAQDLSEDDDDDDDDDDTDEEDDDEEEYGSPGYEYGPPRRPQRPHRKDDDEYVQWCLTNKPGGKRGRGARGKHVYH